MLTRLSQSLNKIIAHFRHSKGFRFTVITVIGNFLATSVSAVTIILISRLLGPEQFGVFSVGFAIVLILSRFCDAGLNAALLKFASSVEKTDQNNQLFSYAIKLKLLLTLVTVVIGLLATPLPTSLLRFPQPAIVILSFLCVVFIVWYEQLIAILQALHRFPQAVLANLYQSTAKLIGIVLIFILGIRSSALIFGWYMLAPIVPVLVAKKLLPATFKLSLNTVVSPSQKLLFGMAKHSAVGFIAAGLIENVDILFVQRYLTTFETGLLGGVSRISMMILLIAYSLGSVLYPRVAQYKDAANMAKYLKKAGLIALAAVLGFLVFVPFSQLSILLTIGPEYITGNSILLILVASSFLTVATIPFLAVFYVFQEEWYFSVSGIGQLAIIILGNYLFVPTYGLEAAAWSRLACRVFLCGFTIGLALYLYRKKYSQVLAE